LFWGLKEWETDDDRWRVSSGYVDVVELAAKLPECSGKPKTTGLFNYDCCDLWTVEMLRIRGQWLKRRYVDEIVLIKASQIPQVCEISVGNDYLRQSSIPEHLPDESSLNFVRVLEGVDIMDKLPMDDQLRQFWNAVRENRIDYQVAVKVLEARGWDKDKIKSQKNKLLRVIAKAQAIVKTPYQKRRK